MCIVKVSMVLVNIVAVLLLMQHAAHLPTSKNLPHVIDLLAPVADLKVLGGGHNLFIL